eukprot:3370748-Rhodomonas_salina.1
MLVSFSLSPCLPRPGPRVRSLHRHRPRHAIALRACYCMSSTELAYGATRYAVLTELMVLRDVRTDIAYVAAVEPHLLWIAEEGIRAP